MYGESSPPLPRKKYPCVVIDPPWPMNDRATRLAPSYKGSQREYAHYDIMTLAEICTLPLHKVLRHDAWVFLWIPNALRREGVEHLVTRAWGLTLTGSELVWCKVTQDGKPRIGGGHYFRSAHEVCLVCRRGRPKRAHGGLPSWFTAPRRLHSEKPREAYELIEAFCLGPYLDLFARRPHDGWDGWGLGYER